MPRIGSMAQRSRFTTDDERAIQSLLVRYATSIDSRDWQLFRSCFAQDCEADYGRFGRWRGPRELADYMESAHRHHGPTLHRITNIVIEHSNDEVRARSYVDAVLTTPNQNGGAQRASGYYDDCLIRTAEGWRITRRKFTIVDAS